MRMQRLVLTGFLELWLGVTASHAAGFPERPIDVIVPFSAGTATDLMMRTMAESMRGSLGQPVVVSDKDGAGGSIAVSFVSCSKPDGYTLLFAPALVSSVLPIMQGNVAYNPNAIIPICQAFENQMALVVRPDSPYKTVGDLLASG